MNGSQLPEGLLLGWYGDDFTGSAAVMEVLSFAGCPSVLFLDIPTAQQLAEFSGVRAIGLAGTARSCSPSWMQQHLPPVFEFLKSLQAPLLHYKVCSTLDSSPRIGSIGAAIDIAAEVLQPAWMPLLLAAPAIRRYQAFGHLFAAAPDGIYRLDRHPVMSRHPVTPMDESDVCKHLAQQTDRQFGLVDLVQLGLPDGGNASLQQQRSVGAEIIALDTVDASTLRAAGSLMWSHRDPPVLAIGSQGIEYALVEHWRACGCLPPDIDSPSAGQAEHMAIVSGSVSSVTGLQIDHALANGYASITFDAAGLLRESDDGTVAIDQAVRSALSVLEQGGVPVIHTARGPDDPALRQFRQAQQQSSLDSESANHRLGAALGKVLRQLVLQGRLTRAIVCGGDTSGHATNQLGLYAMSVLAETVPGAALFKAHSLDPAFNGLELALKGGQMGTPDFFNWIRLGGGAVNHRRSES